MTNINIRLPKEVAQYNLRDILRYQEAHKTYMKQEREKIIKEFKEG